MKFFKYDSTSDQAEYYELLHVLMERWEYEIVEFKEAKGQYSTDKIGQYFSAISNEANLKHQQYGWFILGVSETVERHVVGTNFKQGDKVLIEKFKYEIGRNTTDGITFTDIIELFPEIDGDKKRVLMFKVPAASVGMPTAWKNRYFARSGESLIDLQQYKIDQIRSEERKDWSKLIVTDSSIDCLDKDAIALARSKYKEKMNRPHIAEEVNTLSDMEFLKKIKLMVGDKVTNAALLLLGKPECDNLFSVAPQVMWRLYNAKNELRDYEIFTIPFIGIVDKVFSKVRNLVYRYMPNQLSLFPTETQQYDVWLLRELINNCIAHSNYQLGGRIYINEFEDSINITNPGDFIPGTIEAVLKPSYNPPFHRNQLLADAMVNFHMIDTATSGIKKVFRIQRNKYFPMPDYDFSIGNQVGVTIYGKILDENYTRVLFENPDLDISVVFLIDRVQKHLPISSGDAKLLRKHNLIEGKMPNVFISSRVAASIGKKDEYVKNKAFDEDSYYKWISSYLETYSSATKSELVKLLKDKLPEHLSDEQKERRVRYLIKKMSDAKIIRKSGSSKRKTKWVLVK
jgi:ATP-dependent DNA helicase RecG